MRAWIVGSLCFGFAGLPLLALYAGAYLEWRAGLWRKAGHPECLTPTYVQPIVRTAAWTLWLLCASALYILFFTAPGGALYR